MNLSSLLRGSQAVRARLEQHRPSLFRLAYAWSHDRALADDLAQEALAKGLEHADQLRDMERLRSWLFGILANCWRDHLRALRPNVDIDSLDEECLPVCQETPDVAYGRAQTVALIRGAIARLPVGQRQVVTLIDLEELSYAEVAAILAIPIGTVMSRLCRARIALRDQLWQSEAAQPHRLRSAK
jgi:RNA polymerase sigma-70 factor (ECF subfamily)